MARPKVTHPKKRGRKSKWDTHVQPYLKKIQYWRRMDTMEKDIAKVLDVHVSTFEEYKSKYPELREALKQDKIAVAAEFFHALHKRAKGYEYREDVVVGDRIMTVKRHVPPNPTSIIFGLKNLDVRWRDVQEHEHHGQIDHKVTQQADPQLLEQMQALLTAELNRQRSAAPTLIDLDATDATVSTPDNGNGNGRRKLVKDALKDITP